MNEQPSRPDQGRSRRQLLLIVTIAFAPVIGAYLLYFYLPAMVPTARSNHGQLISPPLEASALGPELADFAGRWTMIAPVAGTDCNEACDHHLYLARQVHVALGKDSDRVERVLLHSGLLDAGLSARLADHYPAMKRLPVSPEALSLLAAAASGCAPGDCLFLADPLGNVMMYYEPGTEGGDLLADLKHLLRLSNIG